MGIIESKREQFILSILNSTKPLLTKDIVLSARNEFIKISKITINRDLNNLITKGAVQKEGKGKNTRYILSSNYSILKDINLEEYFKLIPEDRNIIKYYNFNIFDTLNNSNIFSTKELEQLKDLEKEFREQISKLSLTILNKEYERLTIELSWKSSAIEGNTYSLLETETLLKDGIMAKGKKKRGRDYAFKS